jgi:hypothetical protein
VLDFFDIELQKSGEPTGIAQPAGMMHAAKECFLGRAIAVGQVANGVAVLAFPGKC